MRSIQNFKRSRLTWVFVSTPGRSFDTHLAATVNGNGFNGRSVRARETAWGRVRCGRGVAGAQKDRSAPHCGRWQNGRDGGATRRSRLTAGVEEPLRYRTFDRAIDPRRVWRLVQT